MQARALFILFIAVLLGGVAVYLVQTALVPEEIPREAAAEPATPMVDVVVAARDVTVGSRLEPEHLTTAPFPAQAVPSGTYRSVADVIGLGPDADRGPVVIREMRQGEVVLPHRISPPGARAGLTVRIPEDKRAVTISTDEIQGVAGFVLPGDRVDILHTTTAGRLNDDLVTRKLMQDMQVLAIDQISDENGDDPRIARAVTLLATPEQAQKITLAQRVGQVKLALRSEFDHDKEIPARVIRTVDLINRDAPPVTPAVRNATPNRHRVEVIRGLEVENEQVERGDEPASANAAG